MSPPQFQLTELADRIRTAVTEELRVASAGLPFRVVEILKYGGILTLELEPQDFRSSLDESMDEGRLGWNGVTNGSADIISVLPQLSYVNAVLTSGRPPLKGGTVFINPARFLAPLVDLWERPTIADGATRWYFQLGENSHHPEVVPTHSHVKGLRPAQEAAFGLVGWDVSFLWGPPGTGKTSTLGWLLASYLRERPRDRVLLLSTTNSAVDLAILSVDKAIPEVFGPAPRPSCLRFGSRFDPKKYDDRSHLVPVRDKALLKVYDRHLQAAPDPAEAERYLAWKKQLEALRQQIREQNREFLRNARLAAMTATYATFQYDELVALGRYDLVVFDEASQVGKAHAMTLAALGKRVLFAGDPKQLSPIVQANSEDVWKWLGQSAFEWESRSSLRRASCMLDEQWRMAEPISGAVSDLFYDSKLKVAAPAQHDPAWLAARKPGKTSLLEPTNVALVDLGVHARPAHRFNGYCCPESAEVIAALTVDFRLTDPDSEILILTPYRAQRHEIRKQLQSINASGVLASTVHRAQGSERSIVIFDPVRPSSEFVSSAEGMRLMNVALSRAQARLIVLLHADWRENDALKRLATKFQPARLDATRVDWLVHQKLPNREVPRPVAVAPRPVPKPAAKPATLLEKFEAELYSGFLSGPDTEVYRKQFYQDLSGRAAYNKKLTYTEKDAALAAVSRRLPPPVKSKAKTVR
jgi:DNA replication ATP-dependent helicase Dna2